MLHHLLTVLSLLRNWFFRKIPKIQPKSNLWHCKTSFARLVLRLHIACRISREIYGAVFSERSSYRAEEIKPGSNSISQDNYLRQNIRHPESQIDLSFFFRVIISHSLQKSETSSHNVKKICSEIWRECSNTVATSDKEDTNPSGLAYVSTWYHAVPHVNGNQLFHSQTSFLTRYIDSNLLYDTLVHVIRITHA